MLLLPEIAIVEVEVAEKLVVGVLVVIVVLIAVVIVGVVAMVNISIGSDSSHTLMYVERVIGRLPAANYASPRLPILLLQPLSLIIILLIMIVMPTIKYYLK